MANETQDAPVGATYASEAEAVDAAWGAVFDDRSIRYVVRVDDSYRVFTMSELAACTDDGEVVAMLRITVATERCSEPLPAAAARVGAVLARATAQVDADLAARRAASTEARP